MLFMVIEHFVNGDAQAVYARFRAGGRSMPDDVRSVDSWVAADLERCFQLVQCDDARPLQEWVAAWRDLVAFEFHPVVPSAETAAMMAGMAEAEPTKGETR